MRKYTIADIENALSISFSTAALLIWQFGYPSPASRTAEYDEQAYRKITSWRLYLKGTSDTCLELPQRLTGNQVAKVLGVTRREADAGLSQVRPVTVQQWDTWYYVINAADWSALCCMGEW